MPKDIDKSPAGRVDFKMMSSSTPYTKAAGSESPAQEKAERRSSTKNMAERYSSTRQTRTTRTSSIRLVAKYEGTLPLTERHKDWLYAKCGLEEWKITSRIIFEADRLAAKYAFWDRLVRQFPVLAPTADKIANPEMRRAYGDTHSQVSLLPPLRCTEMTTKEALYEYLKERRIFGLAPPGWTPSGHDSDSPGEAYGVDGLYTDW